MLFFYSTETMLNLNTQAIGCSMGNHNSTHSPHYHIITKTGKGIFDNNCYLYIKYDTFIHKMTDSN